MHSLAYLFHSTARAKVVITANEGVVGGQRLPLKATVDSAVKDTAVELVLVAARTQTEVTMIPGRDLSLDEVKHFSGFSVSSCINEGKVICYHRYRNRGVRILVLRHY